jgi:hypothetical protein
LHVAARTSLLTLLTVVTVGVTKVLRATGRLTIDIISGEFRINDSATTDSNVTPALRHAAAAETTWSAFMVDSPLAMRIAMFVADGLSPLVLW